MTVPTVSVIISAYNSQFTISDSIDSVINQTYKNWGLIIIDDLSNDNTFNIVKSYIKEDKRIKYSLLEKKGGASLERNKVILEFKGKYIAFLDSDDIWYTDKLKKQISFMVKNNYCFTYTCCLANDAKISKETALRTKQLGIKQFVCMSSIIVYGESASLEKKMVITKDTVPFSASFYVDSKLQTKSDNQGLTSNNLIACNIREWDLV